LTTLAMSRVVGFAAPRSKSRGKEAIEKKEVHPAAREVHPYNFALCSPQ